MKLLQWCKANAMPVIAVLAAAVTAVFVLDRRALLGVDWGLLVTFAAGEGGKHLIFRGLTSAVSQGYGGGRPVYLRPALPQTRRLSGAKE